MVEVDLDPAAPYSQGDYAAARAAGPQPSRSLAEAWTPAAKAAPYCPIQVSPDKSRDCSAIFYFSFAFIISFLSLGAAGAGIPGFAGHH